MPRLFRETPLNSIWEGSGNVNCLDVLRAMAKEPAAVEAFLDEVGRARGADARYDAAAASLPGEIARADEAGARRLVERMALVLRGSLLLRYAAPAAADASAPHASRPTGTARSGHSPRDRGRADPRAGPSQDRVAGRPEAPGTGLRTTAPPHQ